MNFYCKKCGQSYDAWTIANGGCSKGGRQDLIAECNRDRNTFVPNAALNMIFGQSPTAIAAVVGNMK